MRQEVVALGKVEIEAASELNHALAAIDLQRQFDLEQQARAHAELANQQKEQLLAVVSHDLRDPLGSICSFFSSSARFGRISPKVSSVLQAMQRSTEP